jgi:hypothetical protein
MHVGRGSCRAGRRRAVRAERSQRSCARPRAQGKSGGNREQGCQQPSRPTHSVPDLPGRCPMDASHFCSPLFITSTAAGPPCASRPQDCGFRSPVPPTPSSRRVVHVCLRPVCHTVRRCGKATVKASTITVVSGRGRHGRDVDGGTPASDAHAQDLCDPRAIADAGVSDITPRRRRVRLRPVVQLIVTTCLHDSSVRCSVAVRSTDGG